MERTTRDPVYMLGRNRHVDDVASDVLDALPDLRLTRRQAQVAAMIACGWKQEEITKAQGVARSTISHDVTGLARAMSNLWLSRGRRGPYAASYGRKNSCKALVSRYVIECVFEMDGNRIQSEVAGELNGEDRDNHR